MQDVIGPQALRLGQQNTVACRLWTERLPAEATGYHELTTFDVVVDFSRQRHGRSPWRGAAVHRDRPDGVILPSSTHGSAGDPAFPDEPLWPDAGGGVAVAAGTMRMSMAGAVAGLLPGTSTGGLAFARIFFR